MLVKFKEFVTFGMYTQVAQFVGPPLAVFENMINGKNGNNRVGKWLRKGRCRVFSNFEHT